MIISLFRRDRQPETISALYGMIVAQARLPAFYRDFAVPDTVNGRFDLIVLHLALVLRRLKGDRPDFPAAGQQLFDLFCADMEGNLREMGIADLKVPKEMRQIGEAFYGRARVYDAALAAPEGGAKSDISANTSAVAASDALAEVLARNVLGATADATAAASRLAAYVRALDRALAGQQPDALTAGRVVFPDPVAPGGPEVM